MSEKFKAFAKTQNGKLILSLSALGLVWLVLLLRFAGNLGNVIPDSKEIEKNLSDIQALQKQNKELKAQEKVYIDLQNTYSKQLETYWNVQKNGDVEIQLRNLVDQAAKSVELQVNSLGSVRKSTIKNELFYAEIDFTSTGTLDVISRFLAEIEKINPKLSWKRVDLSLNRRRTPQQISSGTTTDVLNMNFNGSIRVICVDNLIEEKEEK